VPLSVQRAYSQARLEVSAEDVDAAVDRIAVRITVALQDKNPVLLTVLQGGLVFSGMLMRRLVFPLEQGYVHVGRYGQQTSGQKLNWHGHQHPELAGRCVLIVDDILDEGITLNALVAWARDEGAADVQVAVLVEKQVSRQTTISAACYVALDCPDSFLIGCGMDFQGYGRNLPGIYALDEEV
jgi:hypoxanthine phosphoribosyltransferase